MDTNENRLPGETDITDNNRQQESNTTIERTEVLLEPDLEFIRTLTDQSGDIYRKCMQCGTCSATCAVSPDLAPFPGKEMAWAVWGMKEQLLTDPDVWLCYQCNDCSNRCPRGARPGDVLAAVRQQTIQHYSFPRFLSRWVNEPRSIPLRLGIPAALLTLILVFRTSIEETLQISSSMDERIAYSYSSVFPHWALNSLFIFFGLLVLITTIISISRFWKAMKTFSSESYNIPPGKSLFSSVIAVLQSIIRHDNFSECTTVKFRFWSHLSVFLGFIALCLVTIWVVTAKFNPLISGDFIYPFSLWNPWKVLANLGGLSILVGCSLMIRDRFQTNDKYSTGSYFDWTLISTLFIVVLTGFVTEILHYVRLEPHRHIAYFVHLVFVFALLIYMPYSKFAHVIYRTVALVFAEHSGRKREAKS